MLIGYIGPDDGLERPFCDTLNGKAFARAEFARADNAQVGHPIDYGGGWNCRHDTVWAPERRLADVGLIRGSAADIALASARARGGRKKRK